MLSSRVQEEHAEQRQQEREQHGKEMMPQGYSPGGAPTPRGLPGSHTDGLTGDVYWQPHPSTMPPPATDFTQSPMLGEMQTFSTQPGAVDKIGDPPTSAVNTFLQNSRREPNTGPPTAEPPPHITETAYSRELSGKALLGLGEWKPGEGIVDRWISETMPADPIVSLPAPGDAVGTSRPSTDFSGTTRPGTVHPSTTHPGAPRSLRETDKSMPGNTLQPSHSTTCTDKQCPAQMYPRYVIASSQNGHDIVPRSNHPIGSASTPDGSPGAERPHYNIPREQLEPQHLTAPSGYGEGVSQKPYSSPTTLSSCLRSGGPPLYFLNNQLPSDTIYRTTYQEAYKVPPRKFQASFRTEYTQNLNLPNKTSDVERSRTAQPGAPQVGASQFGVAELPTPQMDALTLSEAPKSYTSQAPVSHIPLREAPMRPSPCADRPSPGGMAEPCRGMGHGSLMGLSPYDTQTSPGRMPMRPSSNSDQPYPTVVPAGSKKYADQPLGVAVGSNPGARPVGNCLYADQQSPEGIPGRFGSIADHPHPGRTAVETSPHGPPMGSSSPGESGIEAHPGGRPMALNSTGFPPVTGNRTGI